MSRRTFKPSDFLISNKGMEKIGYEEALGKEREAPNNLWWLRKSKNPLYNKIEWAFYLFLQILAPKNTPVMRRILSVNNEHIGSAWECLDNDRPCDFSSLDEETLILNGVAELLPALVFLNQSISDQLYWRAITDKSQDIFSVKIGRLNTALGESLFAEYDSLLFSISEIAGDENNACVISSLIKSPVFKKTSFLTFLKIALLPHDFFKLAFVEEELQEKYFGRKLELNQKLCCDPNYAEVMFELTKNELQAFLSNLLCHLYAIFPSELMEDPLIFKKMLLNRYVVFLIQFLNERIHLFSMRLSEAANNFFANKSQVDFERQCRSASVMISPLRVIFNELLEWIKNISFDSKRLKDFHKKISALYQVLLQSTMVNDFLGCDQFNFLLELKKMMALLHENRAFIESFCEDSLEPTPVAMCIHYFNQLDMARFNEKEITHFMSFFKKTVGEQPSQQKVLSDDPVDHDGGESDHNFAQPNFWKSIEQQKPHDEEWVAVEHSANSVSAVEQPITLAGVAGYVASGANFAAGWLPSFRKK